MSMAGDLGNLSPECLEWIASAAEPRAPQDNDGIDESDDATDVRAA
jgi:hypothetical protein